MTSFSYASHDRKKLYFPEESLPASVSFDSKQAPPKGLRKVEIFGVPVTLCSFQKAVSFLQGIIEQDDPQLAVLANAHTLNLAFDNIEYRKVLASAAIVLRDGTGIAWSAKKKRCHPVYNFVGTDFIPDFCRCSAENKYRIYLLGSKPGISELAANRLLAIAPGITVSGCHHGYFSFSETDTIIRRINRSNPDILLVAMGNPRQELWIAHNLSRLEVPLSVGVGALFDFLGGIVPRAHRCIRKFGMEWAFRLALEPVRLWRRYVIGNPKFVFRVYRECFFERYAGSLPRLQRLCGLPFPNTTCECAENKAPDSN